MPPTPIPSLAGIWEARLSFQNGLAGLPVNYIPKSFTLLSLYGLVGHSANRITKSFYFNFLLGLVGHQPKIFVATYGRGCSPPAFVVIIFGYPNILQICKSAQQIFPPSPLSPYPDLGPPRWVDRLAVPRRGSIVCNQLAPHGGPSSSCPTQGLVLFWLPHAGAYSFCSPHTGVYILYRILHFFYKKILNPKII